MEEEPINKKQHKRRISSYHVSTLFETWFLKMSHKNFDTCETIGSLSTNMIFENIEDIFVFSGVMVVEFKKNRVLII